MFRHMRPEDEIFKWRIKNICVARFGWVSPCVWRMYVSVCVCGLSHWLIWNSHIVCVLLPLLLTPVIYNGVIKCAQWFILTLESIQEHTIWIEWEHVQWKNMSLSSPSSEYSVRSFIVNYSVWPQVISTSKWMRMTMKQHFIQIEISQLFAIFVFFSFCVSIA